ncbi:hypothetical protein AVEN_16695-1 [Araneus ventricosus]|uniref:Uncharacterized protein n=1 Tax=Araneus ventricosus TaxID=182803 RepID=A0A4Y2Q7F1_ARAVE|nr:hypothetical protein AVEN_163071-1 [Araneus ventricosus]GBN59023.1 hypothetical protein AVEN_16695-1 [Araneus ventricosus]
MSALIDLLENLRTHIEIKEYKSLVRKAKISVAVAVIVTCFVPCLQTFYYLVWLVDKTACSARLAAQTGVMNVLIHFLYEFSNTYVNTIHLYAVCLFYILFCKTFALCLRCKSFLKSGTQKLQEISVQIFKEIENVFSSVVFIVFTYFLCGYFKIIFLFAYKLKKSEAIASYTYIVDFVSLTFLAITMVLAADSAQRRIVHIHQFHCTFSNDSPTLAVLDQLKMKMAEDHKTLVLSGWGMFIVRKPLLLSLATWLFTYAVIIVQFFYAPAEEP